MLRGIDFQLGTSADVALVPLASPLVAGPGAIATVMVLGRRYSSTEGRVGVFVAIACAVAVVGLSLLLADVLSRRVPPTVIQFVTRVLGLLLAAIGVELVLRGIHGEFG